MTRIVYLNNMTLAILDQQEIYPAGHVSEVIQHSHLRNEGQQGQMAHQSAA